MVSTKCHFYSNADGYVNHDNTHANKSHGKHATYCNHCNNIVYHDGGDKSIKKTHINDIAPYHKKNDKKEDKKDKPCKFKKPDCKLCYKKAC